MGKLWNAQLHFYGCELLISVIWYFQSSLYGWRHQFVVGQINSPSLPGRSPGRKLTWNWNLHDVIRLRILVKDRYRPTLPIAHSQFSRHLHESGDWVTRGGCLRVFPGDATAVLTSAVYRVTPAGRSLGPATSTCTRRAYISLPAHVIAMSHDCQDCSFIRPKTFVSRPIHLLSDHIKTNRLYLKIADILFHAWINKHIPHTHTERERERERERRHKWALMVSLCSSLSASSSSSSLSSFIC